MESILRGLELILKPLLIASRQLKFVSPCRRRLNFHAQFSQFPCSNWRLVADESLKSVLLWCNSAVDVVAFYEMQKAKDLRKGKSFLESHGDTFRNTKNNFILGCRPMRHNAIQSRHDHFLRDRNSKSNRSFGAVSNAVNRMHLTQSVLNRNCCSFSFISIKLRVEKWSKQSPILLRGKCVSDCESNISFFHRSIEKILKMFLFFHFNRSSFGYDFFNRKFYRLKWVSGSDERKLHRWTCLLNEPKFRFALDDASI